MRKAAQHEAVLLGAGAQAWIIEGLAAAHDDDVVDGNEAALDGEVPQRNTEGLEVAVDALVLATALLLFLVLDVQDVGDEAADVRAGFGDDHDLVEHLAHGLAPATARPGQLADARRVIGVLEVVGVGRVEEHQVRTLALDQRRQLARVAANDVDARGGDVETLGAAFEVAADVDGGARADEGVDDEVAFFGVALDDVPDDVAGGRAAVALQALLVGAVVLRRVVPQRRRVQRHLRLAQRPVAQVRILDARLVGGRRPRGTACGACGSTSGLLLHGCVVLYGARDVEGMPPRSR